MTGKQVRALPNGVYLVHWKYSSMRSVASVGRDQEGAVWLAPANWICAPSFEDWYAVKSVTLLAREPDDSPDDLIGMLLAALRDPQDVTALRALQDCIGERIGPPADRGG